MLYVYIFDTFTFMSILMSFHAFSSIFSFENVIFNFNVNRIRSANPIHLEMPGSTIFKRINVSTTFVEQ